MRMYQPSGTRVVINPVMGDDEILALGRFFEETCNAPARSCNFVPPNVEECIEKVMVNVYVDEDKLDEFYNQSLQAHEIEDDPFDPTAWEDPPEVPDYLLPDNEDITSDEDEE